jgi:murein DD-endopeptidase MepM/ murein hydrolase activator NlpD
VDGGVISHVGVIAGRGTVSVLHAGDIKSTYEPVSATVTYGQTVRRGQVLGTLAAAGSHCAPLACLHLGALRRQSSGAWDYFDPLFLLTAVEIVLLPR